MKKINLLKILAFSLSLSISFQSFAAGWVINNNEWNYTDTDNNKKCNSWLQDTDGSWYYFNETGRMLTGLQRINNGIYYFNPSSNGTLGKLLSGWQNINNIWYFFDNTHNGNYGKAVTGWQWIDGYCYYFGNIDENNRMYSNCITPDGYTLNTSGAWTINNIAVYEANKGYKTVISPASTNSSSISVHSSGGSGGGGGGGGSSSSSSSKYYYYTVNCVDFSTGNLIKKYDLSAKRYSTINLDYSFTDYTLNDNQKTSFNLTNDNEVFTLYFSPIKEQYSYAVKYIDIDTNNVLSVSLGIGNKNDIIDIDTKSFTGYTICNNQPLNFDLSKNNLEVFIYYSKDLIASPSEARNVNWTVHFVNADDRNEKIFENQSGTLKEGDILSIDFPETIILDGYYWEATKSSPYTEKLFAQGNATYYIEYEKKDEYTPVVTESKTYSITYLDKETNLAIAITSGEAKLGDKIYFKTIDGYTLTADDDKYFVIGDNNDITVLCKRISQTPSVQEESHELIIKFTNIYHSTEVLPSITTKISNNSDITFCFPQTINGLDDDGNDCVWTSKETSPKTVKINTTESGTIWYYIEYTSEDTPNNKYTDWLNAANEADNKIMGIEPVNYTIEYLDSVNGNVIGTFTSKVNKGDEIEIFKPNFDNYLPMIGEANKAEITTNNQILKVRYDRQEPLINPYPINWTASFVDEDGNTLLNKQEGITFDNEKIIIYFPEIIEDKNGVIWLSDETSPKTEEFSLIENSHDRTITYSKYKDNISLKSIVTNLKENNARISELFYMINDTDTHSFYVIGKDYTPSSVILGNLLKKDCGTYSSNIIDTFEYEGSTYKVMKIDVSRTWHYDSCSHNWTIKEKTPATCLKNGEKTIYCEKCKEELTTIIAATGHVDKNNDSVCDYCDTRIKADSVGDEINLELSLEDGSKKDVNFICLDTNYNGGVLYVAKDDINISDITTFYGDTSNYNESNIRAYLRDGIKNGLSIGSNLLRVNRTDGDSIDDYGFILSESEFDTYKDTIKDAIKNTFTYNTRTANDISSVVSITENYNGSYSETKNSIDIDNIITFKPAIVLKQSTTDEEAEKNSWEIGDIQSRTIDGKIYTFRCIDTDYGDISGNHKNAALFLCDSIIRSDVDNPYIIADAADFGVNNNFRYSNMQAWLNDKSDSAEFSKDANFFNTEKVYNGVRYAYLGSSTINQFEQGNMSILNKKDIGMQYTMDNVFSLSVEEAIKYKDYLWKFEGSNKNNEETQITPYSEGYWLRTPIYSSINNSFTYSNNIYVVDLVNGNIHPTDVSNVQIGIRPAFITKQN